MLQRYKTFKIRLTQIRGDLIQRGGIPKDRLSYGMKIARGIIVEDERDIKEGDRRSDKTRWQGIDLLHVTGELGEEA
jgi:hypothetical protein